MENYENNVDHTIARIMLSLGHSYLCELDISEEEEESEKEEATNHQQDEPMMSSLGHSYTCTSDISEEEIKEEKENHQQNEQVKSSLGHSYTWSSDISEEEKGEESEKEEAENHQQDEPTMSSLGHSYICTSDISEEEKEEEKENHQQDEQVKSSLGHSYTCSSDISEEDKGKENEKKDIENHLLDELEKNLQAEIKFNNKLLHNIQNDTRFQYDDLIQKEFSTEILKEFYSRNLQNSKEEQVFNTEVLNDSNPQKKLYNNQQKMSKDQELPEQKIEIELSIEVPIESQCTSILKRKRKNEPQSSVREMEIQLHLDLQQENECLNIEQNLEEESDEKFNLTFIKFVNQQLEELENELKNNNSIVNEKLKYKFDKIQRLSLSMKFAENLIFNFCGKTKPFYERLNKCDKYFQELNDKLTTNIEVEEHECNAEKPTQHDPKMHINTKETSQQIMNEVTHKVKFDDRKNITDDSSEVIGKNKQLFNNELELESEKDLERSIGKKGSDMNIKKCFNLVEIDSVDIEKNQDEMEEDSDVEIEGFDSLTREDSCVDIEGNHGKIEINSEVDIEENQNETEEDSDVDIEGFDSLIGEDSCVDTEGNCGKMEINSEVENEEEEDSDIDIEGFDSVINENSNVNIEKNNDNLEDISEIDIEENQNETEEDSDEDIVGFREINEVEEIIEDRIVECTSPIQRSNFKNEKTLASNNLITSLKTNSPFCELLNKTTEQNVDFELEENPTNDRFANIDNNDDEDIEVKLDDLEQSLDTQKLKYLNDLLKDKTESFKKFPSFQNELYDNLNQEYLEERKLNGIESSNTDLSAVIEEQKRTFTHLKNELLYTKSVHKELMQQKLFEKQMQDTDIDHLLEITDFPDDLDEILNRNNDEKEFDELQRECNELESEFKYNIPFGDHDFSKQEPFKSENVKDLPQEPYNLFQRLYALHRKQASEFAISNEWPYFNLAPSGLLDTLFEDPSEIKPNVLVISLHSIDIGYSIKITMNPNEPPVETFYSYAENNSILSYVEREQLPPQLLDELDQANPRLYYSACVIAEIHDQVYGAPGELYRLLLRPSNMSIQKDVSLIITQNKSIDWTSEKILKLESKLLLASYPTMCMDILPDSGKAINLQHQQFSSRTLELNPLKKKQMYPKYHSMDTGFFKYPNDNLSKNNKNESQSSSVLMDSVNDKLLLLMRFEIHVRNMKMFVLSALVFTETDEYSILVSSNSNMESVSRIRFKINYKRNEFKTYFSTFFKLVEQKTSFDVKLYRTYIVGQKKILCFVTHVPKLLNDNFYEPNDMDQLLKLISLDAYNFYTSFNTLENVSLNECEIKNKESSMKSSHMNMQTFLNALKSDEKKKFSKQEEDKFKESIQVCTTAKLSNDSTKFLDLSKLKSDLVHKLVHSAPMGSLEPISRISKEERAILLGCDSTTHTNISSETMLLYQQPLVNVPDSLPITAQLPLSSQINIPTPPPFDFTLPSTTHDVSLFETKDSVHDTEYLLSQNKDETKHNDHCVCTEINLKLKSLKLSD